MSDPKKDGPDKKIWDFIWVMGSIMIGLVIAFAIANALIPNVLSGFFGVIAGLGNGIKNLGPMADNLNLDIGSALSGVFPLVIRIMFLVLGFVLAGYFFKKIMDKLTGKSDKKDDHSAKPEAKPEAKKESKPESKPDAEKKDDHH